MKMIVEHFRGNPCPFGRPYIIEYGDCHKCDAYQDCNDAVAPDDDDEEDEEEEEIDDYE
jgi:hypothetical protein